MRIRKDIILTELGNSYIAIPVGSNNDDIKVMARMNDTAVFIWKCLEGGMEEDEIEEKMMKEFEGVDTEKARAAVSEVIRMLKEKGFLIK